MKNALLLLLFLLMVSCKQTDTNVLNIAGSDSILELVQAQAEAYYEKTKTPINLTGGGSGVGINLVINNSTNIANSSREMSHTEARPELIQITIANDLISIVVNNKNPIQNITKENLKKIFTGQVKNWKEIGGNDIPISLYGRQSSSGTYQYVQKTILNNQDYTVSVKEMTGNAHIVRSLELDEGGIAYISYGYYLPKADQIHTLSIDGVNPNMAVQGKKYILSRGVYQIYHRRDPRIKDIHRWFDFIFSPEGKKITQKMGFLLLDKQEELIMKRQIGLI